jgi:type I restriction enzyme S subunit
MRMMSKEKKDNLAPRLRFPEFVKKPTWKERKLSEVLIEHDERSTGIEEVFSVSVHKGVINQIEHLGRSYSAANTENYKRVFPGDVIYTKSPTGDFPYGIIKQSKVSKPVIVSPLYGVFKPETIALGVILNAYFEYPSNVHNYLSSIIQKGAKNTINITNDTFLSKSLIVPTDKDEQQKIADCLSSLDDLITTENQKLETLKAHKIGLVQQLFPAEGASVPKLRFKEFRKSGKWIITTIDKIASISSGGTPSRSKNEYWNGHIPWVSTTLIDFKKIQKTNEFITELGLQNSSTKVFPKDTILMAMYGQGKTRGKVAILGIEATINQACAAITLKKGMNTNFVFQNLAARYDEIRAISNSGGQENLSAELIKRIPFSYPDIKSNEQQKIADFLSSLDDLTAAQYHKVEALKVHKKGLMQQLFPNTNELKYEYSA